MYLSSTKTAVDQVGKVITLGGPATKKSNLDASKWLFFPQMHYEEWKLKTKHGCCFCQADLEFAKNKSKQVYWFDSDSPMCEECAENFE
jgi:hypothetical protein